MSEAKAKRVETIQDIRKGNLLWKVSPIGWYVLRKRRKIIK